MAEAAPIHVQDADADLCLVCTEHPKVARLLDCGHHFCSVCLEKLLMEKTITCPTCRYDTKVITGVDALARYRITNEFSTKVRRVTSQQSDPRKPCDGCHVPEVEATSHCMECCLSFCLGCTDKHDNVGRKLGHRTFPVSKHMFCEEHDGGRNICFCLTCEKVCCTFCFMHAHPEHNMSPVNDAADQARKKLDKVRNEMVAARGDETASETIQKLLEEAKQRKKDTNTSLDSIHTALEELSAKVDKVKVDFNTKIVATIKTLEMMSSDIGDYLTSKVSLRKLLTYLIDDASSPEVVAREKELPKYNMTTYKQVIRDKEVEIPELGDTFSEIKEKLERCQQQLDITFTKHNVCGPRYDTKPLSNLQKVTTVQAGNNTYGLAVDSGRQRLVVRRQDATYPISVYDFQGKQLQVLGKGVEGFTTTSQQGVAIDTKRDLYVLPVNNGSLITMDMNGNVKDKMKVTESDHLEGVAYSEDFYITCTRLNNEVLLTNAETKQKVAAFSPSTTFSYPITVCNGQCLHIEGQAVIVSNYSSHCIKVLDSSGRLLHTYGKEGKSGQGEGELNLPYGVCTDPGGRIIVCDNYNHRVLAFWREDGKDKWQTLLDKDKLGGKENPYHVTCDPVSRRLFVGYTDGTVHVYQ